MRILFQGDSVTDGGRDRRNYFDLGSGYAKYAAEHIRNACPDQELEFINLGIGGNRTDQLFDRIYLDGIKLNPDVISILIGINDIGHRYGVERIATSDAQFELNYRGILDRLKNETSAKIVIMAPYLLDAKRPAGMREDLKKILPIVRKLAEEYADVYIPLDQYFDEALKTQPEPLYYSGDAVHPNENGKQFIGKIYADAVIPVIKQF